MSKDSPLKLASFITMLCNNFLASVHRLKPSPISLLPNIEEIQINPP